MVVKPVKAADHTTSAVKLRSTKYKRVVRLFNSSARSAFRQGEMPYNLTFFLSLT